MKMKKILVALLLSLVSTPALATPFGFSDDGHPPGTLVDVSGIPEVLFTLGHPLFAPGVYDVDIVNGITAWRFLNVVETTTGLRLSEGLGHRVTALVPWALLITSPDLQRASSVGEQWAWTALPSGTWFCGVEDKRREGADNDYNDLTCQVTFVGPVRPLEPKPEPEPEQPIPEPTTLALVATALVAVCWLRR